MGGDGQVSRRRPGATAGGALTGLALGLLALGPGLGQGYLLVYDMVFVPAPRFSAAMFGLSGTLPRAVPSDAVVTAVAQLLPADVVQKGVLLAIFVLASAGVARLLDGEPWPARIAAGVFYAWNPYVAERLLIGQWALLLGYAGLPWVLAALTKPALSVARRSVRLLVALLPAAVGGFAAMAVCALVVLPAAALQRGGRRAPTRGDDPPEPPAMLSRGDDPPELPAMRVATVAMALAVLTLLSLPWLIPSLTRAVRTSPAGVALFAARADTPFGTVGSVLLLGGSWNAQTVPAGYSSAVTAFWLVLVVVAIAGLLLLGRGRWPGVGPAAVAGLIIALLGAFGPGRHLLEWAISSWPYFAVLRDGQQFVAPLALAEALGFGLAVGWVLRVARPAVLREARAVLAAALVIAPVLFLPGLGWGAAGRLRPVQYPATWLAARRIINADEHGGSALLLPWAAYRRPGWNNAEAVLDPWPRLLTRAVIWNDGVAVGSVELPPENPGAAALTGLISAGRPLTERLAAAGVRYVIIDASLQAPAGPSTARASVAQLLPGSTIVYRAPGLAVYRIPSSRPRVQ